MIYGLFIWMLLTGCQTCKKEQIIVLGYLIDERTGTSFNPFPNATVRLILDQSYGYTKELGTASVESDGFYKISITNSKIYGEARVQLVKDEDWQNNVDAHVTLLYKTHHDSIIKCSLKLQRVFFKQTAVNPDSIKIIITNSKGTVSCWVQKKAYNYFLFDNAFTFKGEENNYLSSYIYSGGLYTQYNTTIYTGCRTTVNDTI